MKTHCKRGHEFTKENIYTYRGRRHCLECKAMHAQKQRTRDKECGRIYPSHTVDAKRESHLKALGWTPVLYKKVLKEQEEKCAVCKKPLVLEGGAGADRSCADHEHIYPPKPRGILCGDCNIGLGKFKDNPEVLRAAASYVEKFLLEIPAEAVQNDSVSAFCAGK